jgi:hypothetical protein
VFLCRQDADKPGFIESARRLVSRARLSRSILCATPSSVKCVFLKLNEILQQLHKERSDEESKRALQNRAACLQQILRTFHESVAIFDEVDVILHPLKSELTFSFTKSWIGEDQKHRYLIPEFLIHGLFGSFDESQGYQIGAEIRRFFGTIDQRYKKAVRNQEFIDANFYFENLQDSEFSNDHSIQWWVSRLLVCYLQFHRLLRVEDDPDYIADAILGTVQTALPSHLQDPVCICAKWCQSLLPHVISKHHRYHYGLNFEANGQDRDLMLKAVPFLGKDLPSPDSEFSHTDVTIGFTTLSYMKQDLRKEDVARIASHMKEQLRDGKHRISTLRNWVLWTSEIDQKYRSLEALDIEEVLDDLHEQLKQHQVVKRYYLQKIVLPNAAVYSQKSLSVGSPDLCNMFGHVIGFSGTLSKDLYPLRWKKIGPMPKFNVEHETRIMNVLTSPSHVLKIAYIDDEAKDMEKFNQDWKVKELLEKVAQCDSPCVSCLVDCGALITGLSNLEVARFFMNDVKEEHFCSKFSACVFWDESDAPMAFERGCSFAVPQAACSVPLEKWFVYFDQVHTTGIDIKLPREAVAIVTIGRDTVLRDYVQACWRLRQFGEGQRIQVLLVPEIRRLVTKFTADNLEPGFTPKAASDDAPFVSLEQEEKVHNHGGLNAGDIYKFLSNRQDQQESSQKEELLNQELRVWRRRRMQMLIWDDPIRAVDECFFQEHDEKGSSRARQVPSDCDLTRQETEEKMMVQFELEKCQNASNKLESFSLDAQSVRQRQQERQKESAKQVQDNKQSDAPAIQWTLSDLLSVNAQFFHRISTKFPDVVGFYPDFMHASATFVAALLSPHRGFVLPNVEAIVEVKPSCNGHADSSTGSEVVVFITLQEADTLCRLLRKTSDMNLHQRVSLFLFDSNGYVSNIVPNSCSDHQNHPVASCSFQELDRYIDNPSRLLQGLAFAKLFNCNLQYDLIQITSLLSCLHQWHSEHQTQSVRDAVSSSFRQLAQFRLSGSELKHGPFLMAATHDDLFVEDAFKRRWCPAIKLMLRVMMQIGAFSPVFDAHRMVGKDLQQEVMTAMQSMGDGGSAPRDMFHVVSFVQCRV